MYTRIKKDYNRNRIEFLNANGDWQNECPDFFCLSINDTDDLVSISSTPTPYDSNESIVLDYTKITHINGEEISTPFTNKNELIDQLKPLFSNRPPSEVVDPQFYNWEETSGGVGETLTILGVIKVKIVLIKGRIEVDSLENDFSSNLSSTAGTINNKFTLTDSNNSLGGGANNISEITLENLNPSNSIILTTKVSDCEVYLVLYKTSVNP